MNGWAEAASMLTPAQQDLLRVLAAVVNERPLLGAAVAWPDVFALAKRHELDAFLAGPISAWPVERRPPPLILEAWRQSLRVRAVGAVRLQAQLASVLTALKQAGVRAIPLKGAWLAEHVYADIVSRPMSDIDLLIQPRDLEAATRVLEALGYVGAIADQPGGWTKERAFLHPETRSAIELQWQLWDSSHGRLAPVDVTRLWETVAHEKVAGVAVPVLAPVAHLVYLTYHIQAHLWRFPARAHLDIVLLGRRYAEVLSTETLAAEARAWGLEFRAPFVWRIAHDLCGVEPPTSLAGWAAAADAGLVQERHAALSLALCGKLGKVPMSRRLLEYRQERGWRRLAVGFAALWVPTAQIRHLYPCATRWSGLVGGYAARLIDLLSRRLRDLVPSSRRRHAIHSASNDMALRLRLESWLAVRDHSGR